MIIYTILNKIDKFIESFTKFALVLTVMGMLLLSVTSIVLRWFDSSYSWMEPLIRHLVFLSAFLGGVLATGRGTHIGIDILGRYLESSPKVIYSKYLKSFTAFVSCFVLCWSVYASWGFVQIEWEFGRIHFLGIHSGVLVGIIPFGFTLIAIRFFVLGMKFLCEDLPNEVVSPEVGIGGS